MTSDEEQTLNYADKPGAWGGYIKRKAEESAVEGPRGVRYLCPCCGYPTLEEKRPSWDICELCDWEDDDQDDPKADEVWGGPNKLLSLTEARNNFKRWSNKRDLSDAATSQFYVNTPKEAQAKRTIMQAFDSMKGESEPAKLTELWQQVYSSEAVLVNELFRKTRPIPERFFLTYTPQVADIALQARQLILSILPDAIEQVDTGNKLVGYSTSAAMEDRIFYISAHKAHANIGLLGVDLPDPAGLMEGAGKRLRHVKLRRLEDVDRPALRALLEAAVIAHISAKEQVCFPAY